MSSVFIFSLSSYFEKFFSKSTMELSICGDSVSFFSIHIIFCSKSLSESKVIAVIGDCVSIFGPVFCRFLSFVRLGKFACVSKLCYVY